MDINVYKNDGVNKRVLLEFDHLTLTNDDVQEDMTLTEQVNTEADIMAGACCSVQLSFSVLNLHQLINKADLTGKEFRYREGAQTNESDVWQEMARRGLYLAVRNGAFWYGVNARGAGLNIWDGEQQLDAPVQPAQAVKSIILRDDTLYCVHAAEPYVTAYTIEIDGSLTPLEVAPSAFEIEKLQRYNVRESALNLTGNILLDYQKEWQDGSVVACKERVIEFSDIGYFTPETVDRKNDNMLAVTAYDRMTRFDSAADAYLDSVAYPVTLLSFLQGLCAFYGVTLATSDFPNSGYMVQQNIQTANLPGRQLLQWIAQAAVRFARFDAAGRLTLEWYSEKDYTITASHYTELEVSEYDTAPIDKVQIHSTSEDIGVIVGDGENAYVIENNPLFYADTDAELRPAAEIIYAQVNGLSYAPYRTRCRGNPLIRAGDIVTVESRKGQLIRALIMSRTLKGVRALSDSYEATGNPIREQQPQENYMVTQLRGKVNEISVTLDGTINRLYDASTGDITVLQATTQGIEATVSGVSGQVAQNTAQILIQAGQISSKVSQTDFNGNTVASLINQTATTILIQARKINLDGYVTATDLTTGNLTITGKLESIYGSEKISMFNGYIELYYGGSLMGSLYTNSNYRQNICLSSRSGQLLFAAGGYLRGRILSDGTLDNQQYDIQTSGDVIVSGSGNYYASGYRGYTGTFKDSNNKTVTVSKGIITNVS